MREPNLIMPNFSPRGDHLARPQVADDPPGDRPGNLPHDQPAMRRRLFLQADPHVLVPQGAFRLQGVEELARRVAQGDHPAPAAARFMWTLKIDRKMPIRTAGPPMNSSCSSRVISAIVPSAGETIRPGSCGTRRGGSRKK